MFRTLVLAALGNGSRALAAFLLAVLLLSRVEPSAAQTAEANAWRVVTLSGDVALRRGGATPVAFGNSDALLPGDTLQTGPGGRLVLRRGEDTVIVAPNSSVTLPSSSPGGLTSLIQSLGTLLVKVDRRATPNFEVRTPYLIAVVKGTSFSVSVDGAGAGVHVLQGQVQVSDPRGNAPPALLTPGSTARMPSTPGRPMQIDGPARRSLDAAAASGATSLGMQAQDGDTAPAGTASAPAAVSGPIQSNAPVISSVLSTAALGGIATLLPAPSGTTSEVRTITPVTAPKPLSAAPILVASAPIASAPIIVQPLALAAVDVESSSKGLVGNDDGSRDKSGSRGGRRGRDNSGSGDRDRDKDRDKENDKDADKDRKRGDDSRDDRKRSDDSRDDRKRGDDSRDDRKRGDDSRDTRKGSAGEGRDGGGRGSAALGDGKGSRGGSGFSDSKATRSVAVLSIASLDAASHDAGGGKRKKKGKGDDRGRRK